MQDLFCCRPTITSSAADVRPSELQYRFAIPRPRILGLRGIDLVVRTYDEQLNLTVDRVTSRRVAPYSLDGSYKNYAKCSERESFWRTIYSVHTVNETITAK